MIDIENNNDAMNHIRGVAEHWDMQVSMLDDAEAEKESKEAIKDIKRALKELEND